MDGFRRNIVPVTSCFQVFAATPSLVVSLTIDDTGNILAICPLPFYRFPLRCFLGSTPKHLSNLLQGMWKSAMQREICSCILIALF